MKYNTEWNCIPRQCKTATILRHRFIENAAVINVEEAFIRGSKVSGFFKLADGASIKNFAGKRRIEVECLWFGRKPRFTWMNLTLHTEPKFLYGYSGKVALDIRR